MLIAIVIIGFIAVGMIDLNLRKKFNIEKNIKFMDQYVGVWHLVLEIFLCLLFLWYMTGNAFNEGTIYSLLIAFIMVLFALRGLFEFLLKREKRRHIISFTYVGLCAFFTVAILVLK